MTKTIQHFLKQFIKGCLVMLLAFSLALFPFIKSTDAAKTVMTGDFTKDTISVSQSLQETISIPNDDEARPQAQKESLVLITDYISRYRNRPQVNQTMTYTTMQTALNSMAGHIKTFSNRPIPDELKARLSKELSKAEQMVTSEK